MSEWVRVAHNRVEVRITDDRIEIRRKEGGIVTVAKTILLGDIQESLTSELKANYDTAYTHSQSAHAPSTAQKNSDITKGEIEAVLTGEISTHSHGGGGLTQAQVRRITRR